MTSFQDSKKIAEIKASQIYPTAYTAARPTFVPPVTIMQQKIIASQKKQFEFDKYVNEKSNQPKNLDFIESNEFKSLSPSFQNRIFDLILNQISKGFVWLEPSSRHFLKLNQGKPIHPDTIKLFALEYVGKHKGELNKMINQQAAISTVQALDNDYVLKMKELMIGLSQNDQQLYKITNPRFLFDFKFLTQLKPELEEINQKCGLYSSSRKIKDSYELLTIYNQVFEDGYDDIFGSKYFASHGFLDTSLDESLNELLPLVNDYIKKYMPQEQELLDEEDMLDDMLEDEDEFLALRRKKNDILSRFFDRKGKLNVNSFKKKYGLKPVNNSPDMKKRRSLMKKLIQNVLNECQKTIAFYETCFIKSASESKMKMEIMDTLEGINLFAKMEREYREIMNVIITQDNFFSKLDKTRSPFNQVDEVVVNSKKNAELVEQEIKRFLSRLSSSQIKELMNRNFDVDFVQKLYDQVMKPTEPDQKSNAAPSYLNRRSISLSYANKQKMPSSFKAKPAESAAMSDESYENFIQTSIAKGINPFTGKPF